jgi:hypothetical protein
MQYCAGLLPSSQQPPAVTAEAFFFFFEAADIKDACTSEEEEEEEEEAAAVRRALPPGALPAFTTAGSGQAWSMLCWCRRGVPGAWKDSKSAWQLTAVTLTPSGPCSSTWQTCDIATGDRASDKDTARSDRMSFGWGDSRHANYRGGATKTNCIFELSESNSVITIVLLSPPQTPRETLVVGEDGTGWRAKGFLGPLRKGGLER